MHWTHILGAPQALGMIPVGLIALTCLAAPSELSTVHAHRWAAEVDLVQPFIPTVHIVRARLTWTAWGEAAGLRGDLVGGLYIRPHVPHDVVETIDEYLLIAGYRQYVWRGLHAEALLNGGVAWGTNLVDGKDYTTPSLFLDLNVGYRFGFYEPGGFFYRPGEDTVGFYFAPQFATASPTSSCKAPCSQGCRSRPGSRSPRTHRG